MLTCAHYDNVNRDERNRATLGYSLGNTNGGSDNPRTMPAIGDGVSDGFKVDVRRPMLLLVYSYIYIPTRVWVYCSLLSGVFKLEVTLYHATTGDHTPERLHN